MAGANVNQEAILRREIALANAAFYASEYLTGERKAPYNGRFLISEHHQEWAKLINAHKRLCILAARDSGKSFFFSKAVPLWLAEKNPWSGTGPQPEGLLFGSSQPKVRKAMMKIKREVETNPNLKHMDPRDGRGKLGTDYRWSADCLEFANGFVLSAFGFDTRARGEHPLFAIIDDALTEDDAYSDTVREKHHDYFLSVVEGMMPPESQVMLVGTPFHTRDVYGRLDDNEEFKVFRYPAIINYGKPGERALWPERYPLEALAKKRRTQGPLIFTREYLVDPVSDVASLFPRALWNEPKIRQPYTLGQYDWKKWRLAGIERVVFGIDIALSTEAGSDYFVIFVLGLDKFGNRWVLDIAREVGLKFHLQLELIKTMHKRYRADLIFIESNQMQAVWRDELVRTTDLPVQKFVTSEEKHSLVKGLPSNRIPLENAKYRIPDVPEQDDENIVNIFIEEARAHALKDGKVFTSAPHDDTTFAWYIAEQALDASNFGFAFDSDDDDEEAYQQEQAELLGETADGEPIEEEEDEALSEEDLDEADAFIRAQPGYQKARTAQLAGLEDEQGQASFVDEGGQRRRSSKTPPPVKFTIHDLANGTIGKPRKIGSGAPPKNELVSIVQGVLRGFGF